MVNINFKSVVVTTDLSEDSVKAYSVARSLKDHYTSTLTVLSCIDTSIQYGSAGISALEVPTICVGGDGAEAVRHLQRALSEHIHEHLPGTDVTIQVLQGAIPVEHSIVSFAKQHSIDLIIMASHGRSGIKRALLGSVAEYVVRHSPCPVLVVPTRQA